jgi:hypothetical protein
MPAPGSARHRQRNTARLDGLDSQLVATQIERRRTAPTPVELAGLLQRFHNCCTQKPPPSSAFFIKKRAPFAAPQRAWELWNALALSSEQIFEPDQARQDSLVQDRQFNSTGPRVDGQVA